MPQPVVSRCQCWSETTDRADTGEHSGARQFLDVIDRVYRAAVDANRSLHNQIAYGNFLARHGRPLESLTTFYDIAACDNVTGNPQILSEIVHHVARIERQLEEVDETGQWTETGGRTSTADGSVPEADGEGDGNGLQAAREFVALLRAFRSDAAATTDGFRRLLAEMKPQDLGDARSLLRLLRERNSGLLRQTGRSLLKLALFCGERNWGRVEAECIRQAIQCFQGAAKVPHLDPGRSLAEPPVART